MAYSPARKSVSAAVVHSPAPIRVISSPPGTSRSSTTGPPRTSGSSIVTATGASRRPSGTYDRETFRRIDHNNDNWISQREFLGETDVDDDAEDLFAYLDANDDRRVSRDEWHGTRARFDALDRDRDGVLTRAEAAGTDAPADLFEAIDLNNDRLIARSEWRWSPASFDARDGNRDGRLSRDEFDNVAPNRTGTYRAGYDRGMAEGRQAGREDRERNQGWDLDGQRELEQADSGYDAGMGPRAEYQAGYREGFTRGYREGWGG